MSDDMDEEIEVGGFEGGDFDDGGFDDFEGGDSLGGMSRENPMFKIGIVLGAFAAIVGGIILFGGDGSEGGAPSMIMTGAQKDVKGAPGEDLTEMMEGAITDKNIQRVEEAIQQQRSAMPTPTSRVREEIILESDSATEAEDPLERWRRIQEERQKKEQEIIPDQADDRGASNEAVEALASAMAEQMTSILETKEPQSMQHVQITVLEEEGADSEEGDGAADSSEGDGEEVVQNIIIPAGTIEYAQLLTEANTDAPGPILAQLASGPLAGSRLIGTFEAAEEYLILSFDTVVIDGISHSIDAVALDPDTTLPGLATEVDKRYFSRIVLPAAAAFVSGMGAAIADTGSTSVSVTGGAVAEEDNDLDTREEVFKGIEEAANKVEEVLSEETSDIQPLIRVAAGTAMGLLFVEPVTEDAE